MLPLLDTALKVGVTIAVVPALVDILRRHEHQPAIVGTVLGIFPGIARAQGLGPWLAEAIPVLGRIGFEVYIHDLNKVKLVAKLVASVHYLVSAKLVPFLPNFVQAWERRPDDKELAGYISDLVSSAARTLDSGGFVSFVPILMRIASAHPHVGYNAMLALVLLLERPQHCAGVVAYIPAVVAWMEDPHRGELGVIDAMSVVLRLSDSLSDDTITRLGRVVADIIVPMSSLTIRDRMSVVLEFIDLVQAGIGCSDLERISTMYDNPRPTGLGHGFGLGFGLGYSVLKLPALPALATKLLVRGRVSTHTSAPLAMHWISE